MNRRTKLTQICAAMVFWGVILAAQASSPDVSTQRQYTYAWQFSDDDDMKPRGGTTRGTQVTLVDAPTAAWARLQESDLTKQERDRRAILAMAGPYRTSFDFLETVGFTPGYTPTRPYQSWGTEYVYVIADEPDRVSLQHILVMHFAGQDSSAPAQSVVVKHWRQDWHYQQRDLSVFIGHSRWRSKRLSRKEASGKWVQAVYQVDDSPRYQAAGEWIHHPGYSSWISDETWRPLPRREFSVRDDYQVLIGTNRHTIYPTGWVQEEDNLKVVLNDEGELAKNAPILAREAGLARYERIANHDWSAGDEYWARTSEFWAVVRDVWADLLSSGQTVALAAKNADGQSLFSTMFKMAEAESGTERWAALTGAQRNERVLKVLAGFLP